MPRIPLTVRIEVHLSPETRAVLERLNVLLARQLEPDADVCGAWLGYGELCYLPAGHEEPHHPGGSDPRPEGDGPQPDPHPVDDDEVVGFALGEPVYLDRQPVDDEQGGWVCPDCGCRDMTCACEPF